MERMIILGRGGHAASLVDALERQNLYEIAGYVVNDAGEADTRDTDVRDAECRHTSNLPGKYPVLGGDDSLAQMFQSGIRHAAVGIGFLGESDLRERLWRTLKGIGFSLPVICDPSAVLAGNVSIGEGAFIGKGAIINVNAQVGRMCIINTGAIVEHDCQVGDFSHVSVGSVLCGGVQIGRSTFVGANATVIQGRRVGDGCIVAAGTTVRKDVEEHHVVFGRRTENIHYRRSGGQS